MNIRAQLLQKFSDFVYRHAYADEYLNSAIATQIQVLREQRGLTQTQFASLLEMKQSQVARMENVNNSGWQLRTLKRVARALDLFLVVKFESFGAVLPDIEVFGRTALTRPSFADDPVFNAESTALKTVIDLGSEEAYTGERGVGDVLTASGTSGNNTFGLGAYRRVA